MSYIVPRDIPKNCFECPCCTLGYCRVDVKTTEYAKYVFSDGQDGRYPDCPLIEIPTPHGRLIDADKFAETLKEVSIRQGYDKLFSDNILSVGDVFDAIAVDLKGEGLDKYKLAPTVIEAEGET